MRKMRWLKMVMVIILLLLPLTVMARDIDPIVSTDWLEKNLKNSKMVIVDLRKVEEYKAGHIPGAVFFLKSPPLPGTATLSCS